MSNDKNQLETEIMCVCSGTRRGEIQKLFEQGFNADAISRKTGALSGCGGCEWDVCQFLHELSQEKNPNT